MLKTLDLNYSKQFTNMKYLIISIHDLINKWLHFKSRKQAFLFRWLIINKTPPKLHSGDTSPCPKGVHLMEVPLYCYYLLKFLPRARRTHYTESHSLWREHASLSAGEKPGEPEKKIISGNLIYFLFRSS